MLSFFYSQIWFIIWSQINSMGLLSYFLHLIYLKCKLTYTLCSITDVRLGRQGLEKRVVSQDLELWLSNVRWKLLVEACLLLLRSKHLWRFILYAFFWPLQMPAKDKQFTLLARAGRQVGFFFLYWEMLGFASFFWFKTC